MSEADAEPQAGRDAVWIEKYRPQTLDEVVGQEDSVERLESYVERRDLPHLLFSGPAGVGKCVTGETPVLTGEGLARMETVVGDVEGFERAENGPEVLTLTDRGEFEYTVPSHRFSKTAEEVMTVRTRDGGEATVTPEHRLLVVNNAGLTWRKAADLGPGDRVARPLEAPLPESGTRLDWLGAMDGEETVVHVSEEFAQNHDALDATGTTCPLSSLRSLDVPEEELHRRTEAIQHVSTTNDERSPPIDPPQEVTPELARFVGLAVSKARVRGGRVTFDSTDEALLDQFETALENLFDLEPKRGTRREGPYVAADSRTLTAFLSACFDVFANATGTGCDGPLGSTILRAGADCRRAFVRGVFDAEGHVTESGTLELARKDGDLTTVLSYLLAGFGVPSRRKQKRTAGDGSGGEREHHTLCVSGSANLARFADEIGFTVEPKATRLETDATPDTDADPDHDTVPVQHAVDEVCESLRLPKSDLVTRSVDPESPGREEYERDLVAVIEAATDRIEQIQEVVEDVSRLEAALAAADTVPVVRAGTQSTVEPVGARRERADGQRPPSAERAQRHVGTLDRDDELPATEEVQRTLRDAADTLGVTCERVAEGTHMPAGDVSALLNDDDIQPRSFPRFATVASALESLATELLSMDVLEQVRTLDRLVESSIYVDEVTDVERRRETRRVYDLTVPGPRNYVAGRVPTVMHNTTCAAAIARELYGEDWGDNFLELNASDERGIDVVRDRIKSFARTSFGGVDHRIIFLDEADALCVPPGTGVVTGSPSSPELKPIEAVSENGEPIPSVDFETNEIQSDSGKLVDSGVADFFELDLDDGRTTLASPGHPFFVVGADGKLVEKELRELSPGDEVADFKDEVGVSRCETCDDWTAGRFCSVDCKSEVHSHEMQGLEPALVSDGGLQEVQTATVCRIEYSHRGKAYNISMEGTPNFVLANGILTHNTSDAQSALRRTMEQFSNNVRFILSCNYSSQIIDPIQSRCAVFRFSPLSDEAVAEEMRHIAEAEGIELTEDGIGALVYAADGDMRTGINALQAASVTGGVVDEEAVYELTSTARPEEVNEMVEQALAGDFTAARSTLDRLLTEEGIAGGDVIDQLHRGVWEFDLEDEAAVRLLDRIGETEYRITRGASERVQLEALLASLALDDRD
jgi:DNA polymerase III delta prime subunit